MRLWLVESATITNLEKLQSWGGYLKGRGAEVKNMMTMEYNHDLELQASKEEGFEEGIDSEDA